MVTANLIEDIQTAVITMLADAHSMSDSDLRKICWWTGYLYEQVPNKYKYILVKAVITASENREADTHYWCLACFRDAYELMSEDTAWEYVRAWIHYSRRVGGFHNAPLVVHFTRMYRMSSLRIRQMISTYEAECCAKKMPVSPEYRDYLCCVHSEMVSDSCQATSQESLVEQLPSIAQREQFTVALVMPEYLSGKSFLQPPLDMLLASTHLKKAGFKVILDDIRTSCHSLSNVAQMCSYANLVVVCTSPYDQVQNYFVDFRLRHTYCTIRDHLKSHVFA